MMGHWKFWKQGRTIGCAWNLKKVAEGERCESEGWHKIMYSECPASQYFKGTVGLLMSVISHNSVGVCVVRMLGDQSNGG